MVSSIDRDLRRFKQQSNLLTSLLIQAEVKQWPAGTVVMDKGQMVLVGGRIMPKDPPASRQLTDQEMQIFLRGGIKNFADLNALRGKAKSDPEAEPQAGTEVKPETDPKADAETEAKAKTLIDSAMEIINKALGNVVPQQVKDFWVDPKVKDIRKKIGDAIGVLGTAAQTAYNAVLTAFTNALTGAFDAGKAAGKDARDTIDAYKQDPAAFKAKLKKDIGTIANTAMQNIKNAPGNAKDALTGGVGAAMTAISTFLNNLAFPDQADKSFGENAQAQLVAMVSKLNLPADIKNKLLREIKGMKTPNKEEEKRILEETKAQYLANKKLSEKKNQDKNN